MKLSPHRLGALGERVAADYLRTHGYRILYRNVKTKAGEIDIVALKHRMIVIAEVKTRQRLLSAEIAPLEAVDSKKRKQIRRLTMQFARQHSLQLRRLRVNSIRFDVIAIVAAKGRWPTLRHVPDAFSQ
ncbi:MAG: YraN family protein [Oligoflexia bacterium]|nr:YraN family protein [Oligoflexia bacterium]